MVRALLLGSLLLLALHTLGQAYEPGLLVRSNGDTLRGEIENGFWKEPPTFIHFRPDAHSVSQLFQPRQLRAVSFAGGRYFRYLALPIDHAAQTDFSSLTRGYRPDVRTDSLLAEVLVEGPLTLLRVLRPGSAHYLFQRPGQPVLEVCERRYLRQTATGAWAEADGNNYRNQLALYFGDCAAASRAAQDAPFTAKGMVAVAEGYNTACSSAQQPGRSWLAQAVPRRRVALQGGVLAGVRYNRLHTSPSEAVQLCFDCQVRPFGGLYADLFLPSRTTALYGEFSASQFVLEAPGTLFSSAVGPQPVRISSWLLTARLGVRYFFTLAHEQQILVGLGLGKNQVVHATSTPANAVANLNQLEYPEPVVIPNIGLGWRNQRLTLMLDGQMYHTGYTASSTSVYIGNLLGSNFTLRASVAYRLGSNQDQLHPAAHP